VRIVLDTNVFISGVFFGGPPARILEAWRDGRIQMVVSESILDEYRLVGERLAARFEGVTIDPLLRLLSVTAKLYRTPGLPSQVCDDPDDDKFIACALASGSKVIITGDRGLLRVSGYRGIKILTVRDFIDRYLKSNG
jgi:putative PIN family toxin of toxin-antitoxin system